jgi:predicted RNase H-like nuclease (RuvC/YqgF family)
MSRKITLHISTGFTLPPIYQSKDVCQVEQALLLGAMFAETVPTTLAKAKDSEFATVLQQKEQEADIKEAALKEELNKIKSTMLEAQREIRKLETEHEQALRDMKRSSLETQQRLVQDTKEQTLQQVQKELNTLR